MYIYIYTNTTEARIMEQLRSNFALLRLGSSHATESTYPDAMSAKPSRQATKMAASLEAALCQKRPNISVKRDLQDGSLS